MGGKNNNLPLSSRVKGVPVFTGPVVRVDPTPSAGLVAPPRPVYVGVLRPASSSLRPCRRARRLPSRELLRGVESSQNKDNEARHLPILFSGSIVPPRLFFGGQNQQRLIHPSARSSFSLCLPNTHHLLTFSALQGRGGMRG